MPYELAFTKQVPIVDREQYINECCVGGDVVADRLLPEVRARYTDIQTNQEDWGWFIWFRKDAIKLAIDIFTEDAQAGVFKIHLTSRTRRSLFGDAIADTPELEELRTLVESRLQPWVGGQIAVTTLDKNYM